MNNDLTGTSGSSRIYPTGPSQTPPLPEETLTQGVTTVDLQAYDGTDTMASVATSIAPQQFFIKTSIYDTPSQLPLLLEPDPEGERGPQPYGVAERRFIILNRYYNRLDKILKERGDILDQKAKLIRQFLITGKPIDDAQLETLANGIAKQAKAEIQVEARLPESWDPQSTQADDWIPIPIEPYTEEKQKEINQYYDHALAEAFKQYVATIQPPLSPEKISKLNEAISGGKVDPSIAKAFNTISKTATEETQQAFGLSEAWFKGTTDIENWKPINASIVTPAAVNEARAELILSNVVEMLGNFEKAAGKTQESFEINDPNHITMDEFKRLITRAIRDLKAQLREIQLADAELSKIQTDYKLDAAKIRQARKQEQIEKKREMEEKKKKAEKMSDAMKIAGPIVAGVSVLVGVLLIPFTAGASTVLLVAGVAIGMAMMAYTIVDSVTGCTQKGIELFNEWLKEILPDNPLAQKLVKWAIVTVVVAVLIILIVASGGSAAANIASSVANQIIREAIKQFLVQATIMLVMASNAVPELVLELAKMIPGISEKDLEIIQYVLMAVMMISVMFFAAAAGGPKGLGGVSEGFQSAGRSVQQAASRAIKHVQDLIKKVQESAAEVTLQSIINMLKKAITDLIRSLQNLGNNLVALPGKISKTIEDNIERLQTAAKEILKLLKDPNKLKEATLDPALSRFQSAYDDLLKNISDTLTAAKGTSPTLQDAALRELKAALKRIEELILAGLKKLAEEGVEGVKDIGRGFKNLGEGFGKLKDLWLESKALREMARKGVPIEKIEQMKSQQMRDLQELLISSQKVLQLGANSVDITNGVYQFVIGLQLVKLLNEIGDLKAAEEMLQGLINLLEKMLKSIQTGMDTRSEFIVSQQNALNSFYNAMSQMTTKIFQMQG
jgi:hypothetical protein